MPELSAGQNIIKESTHPTIVGSGAPTGEVGITKSPDTQTGIFIYTTSPYIIWTKDSGVWSVWQTFTAENLVPDSTFRWVPGRTAFYLQTAVAGHTFYAYKRSGALLIDNTPTDNNNVIDTLVLSPADTLRVFGAATTTITETSHAIADGAPVSIADACTSTVSIVEVGSDYSAPLSSKMAAYYKFENNANDSGNSAVHGTASAGVLYESGKLGTAADFSDVTSVIELNNANVLDLGPDWTVAGWVYIPSSQAHGGTNNSLNDVHLFSNSDQYGQWTYLAGILIMVPKPGYTGGDFLNQPNSLALLASCGSGNGIYSAAWYASATGANTFPYDEWVHFAVTMNGCDVAGWGGNERLYINGQSMGPNGRAGQPVQNPFEWGSNVASTRIGGVYHVSYAGRTPAYAGDVKFDEMAIWKRELTAAEMLELYNSGNGVALDTTFATTETVRNDFTIEKSVTITAPGGTDSTDIKVTIEK